MSDISEASVNAQLQARLHQLETAERKRAITSGRLRRLAVALLVVGAFVLPTIATALDVPHAFQAGDPVVAAELNENFQALAVAIDASVIREDMTIQIGPMQTCAAIQQALDDLDGRNIVGTATVTIELLPGTYACEEPIVVRHHAGNRIWIVGVGNSAESVVLTFPADTNGVVVGRGLAFGRLANLTLEGLGSAVGVDAWSGADVYLADVVIRQFTTGLHSGNNASIEGSGVLLVENALGAEAQIGGSIVLQDSNATNNTEPPPFQWTPSN